MLQILFCGQFSSGSHFYKLCHFSSSWRESFSTQHWNARVRTDSGDVQCSYNLSTYELIRDRILRSPIEVVHICRLCFSSTVLILGDCNINKSHGELMIIAAGICNFHGTVDILLKSYIIFKKIWHVAKTGCLNTIKLCLLMKYIVHIDCNAIHLSSQYILSKLMSVIQKQLSTYHVTTLSIREFMIAYFWFN